MKKILFVFFFILISFASFSEPPSTDRNIDRQLRNKAQGINPVVWRDAMSVFSEDEVRGAIADSTKAGSINYYFMNASDSDPLYSAMSLVATSTVSSVTFPAISDAVNWTLCSTFISPQGSPGATSLAFGTYPVRGVVTKGAGASLELILELWKITTASATTFIATSSPLVVIQDSVLSPSVYDFVVSADVSLNTSDRFIFRRYARRVAGTGTSATITSWFGSGYSSYFNFPVAGVNIALANASNITATDSWRSALNVFSKNQINATGQVLIQGAGQVASTGANVFTGKQSLTVASGGFTVYQGNAIYSSSGEANVSLPLNISATSISFDAGTSGYIRAEVIGTNSTYSSCIHVELNAAYEDFEDTLAFIGNPSSITSQLNAATWSASLDASGDSLRIIATGTPGTIWQVKKLEIGGL